MLLESWKGWVSHMGACKSHHQAILASTCVAERAWAMCCSYPKMVLLSHTTPTRTIITHLACSAALFLLPLLHGASFYVVLVTKQIRRKILEMDSSKPRSIMECRDILRRWREKLLAAGSFPTMGCSNSQQYSSFLAVKPSLIPERVAFKYTQSCLRCQNSNAIGVNVEIQHAMVLLSLGSALASTTKPSHATSSHVDDS